MGRWLGCRAREESLMYTDILVNIKKQEDSDGEGLSGELLSLTF